MNRKQLNSRAKGNTVEHKERLFGECPQKSLQVISLTRNAFDLLVKSNFVLLQTGYFFAGLSEGCL